MAIPTSNESEFPPPDSWPSRSEPSAEALLPPSADFESLRQYTGAKLAIADQLRTLLDMFKGCGEEAYARKCEQLMAKLAEDRFTIAILGQFKRGKSSLLNAIIGRDLLPTGILPVTSVITALRFGTRGQVVVYRKGSQFPVFDSVERLANYVTEKQNPGNRRGIEMAVIELPLPFLRRGVEFVDTPGIGSAVTANTETTYTFLPNCDAVLFVTSVDSPLSEAELELLRSIRRWVNKIFFILNKVDLLSDEHELIQVQEFVRSRLSEEMNARHISLIPLSAKRALRANDSDTASEFGQSGLLHLQNKLAQFLTAERQSLFLGAVLDKATQLVTTGLRETVLAVKASEASASELHRCRNKVKAEMELSRAARILILERMQERGSEYFLRTVGQDLATFLGEIGETAAKRLDRLLARARLFPVGAVTRRYAAGTVRLFCARTSDWLRENRLALVNGLNEAVKEELTSLNSQLATLATLPHKMFGLIGPEAVNSADAFESLRLEPVFDPGSIRDVRWTLHLPLAVRFLPTMLIQSWLRSRSNRELQKLVGDYALAMVNMLRKSARDNVQTLAQAVSGHAATLERRADDILHVRTLKQVGQNRAAEGKERAATYRRGMETLNANFASLRQHVQISLKAIDEVPLASVRPISSPTSKASGPVFQKRDVRRGCPICQHLITVSVDFFSAYQFSLYNDGQQQQELAENGGLCSFHLWQLESFSSPVGFSVGVAKLVKRVARALDPVASIENARATVEQIRLRQKHCRACKLLRETEQETARTLVDSLSDEQNRTLYVKSQGVCLRHLKIAIAEKPTEEITRLLLQTASACFRLIAEDMQGYALKRDASRRHIVSDDEEEAHIRAASHLAGAKYNSLPWTFNDEI